MNEVDQKPYCAGVTDAVLYLTLVKTAINTNELTDLMQSQEPLKL
jgi:hypothetical protein